MGKKRKAEEKLKEVRALLRAARMRGAKLSRELKEVNDERLLLYERLQVAKRALIISRKENARLRVIASDVEANQNFGGLEPRTFDVEKG